MIWPWDMANWAGALLAGLSVSAAEAPHADAKTAPAPVPVRIEAARPVPPFIRSPKPGAKAKVAAATKPAGKAAKPVRVAAAVRAAKAPTIRPKPAEPPRVIVLDEVKRTPTVLGWRGEGGTGAHYETGTPLAFKLGAVARGDGGVTGHRPVWRAAPGYSESSYLLTGRAIWRY